MSDTSLDSLQVVSVLWHIVVRDFVHVCEVFTKSKIFCRFLQILHNLPCFQQRFCASFPNFHKFKLFFSSRFSTKSLYEFIELVNSLHFCCLLLSSGFCKFPITANPWAVSLSCFHGFLYRTRESSTNRCDVALRTRVVWSAPIAKWVSGEVNPWYDEHVPTAYRPTSTATTEAYNMALVATFYFAKNWVISNM